MRMGAEITGKPLPSNLFISTYSTVVVQPDGSSIVQVEVSNRGPGPSAASTASVRIDEGVVGSAQVPALEPGQSASAVLSRPMPPGQYHLGLCVDGEQHFQESDEANNCVMSDVVLAPRPAAQTGPTEWVIEPMTIRVRKTMRRVVVNATVRRLAGLAVPPAVRLIVDGNDGAAVSASAKPVSGVPGTYAARLRYPVIPDSGLHTYRLCIGTRCLSGAFVVGASAPPPACPCPGRPEIQCSAN